MKKVQYYLCALALCVMAAGCQKKDAPYLTAGSSSVEFQSSQNSPVEFYIYSNDSWSATCDAEWVSLSPKSGSGSDNKQYISVTAADNTANTSRSATITVKSGSLIKKVAVNQSAVASAVEVKENSLSYDDLGGQKTIQVKSNYDWTVSTSASWLTVSPAKGEAGADFSTVTITAERNLGQARTATVTVSAGSSSSEVSISQDAVVYAAFSVAPASIDVEADATSAEITVTAAAEVEWTATAPEGVSVAPASGKGNGKITVSFAANTAIEPNSFTVTVASASVVETPSYSVDINQAAAPADPEVGDFYFSDGTFGKEIGSKTPIAIVFYVGCATDKNDKDEYYFQKDGSTSLGTVKGYAVALKNATDEAGTVKTYDFSYRNSWGSNEPGTSISTTDFLGYSNTKAIIDYAVEKYDGVEVVNNPATYYTTVVFEKLVPAPANSSGWFIPSLGQIQCIWDTFYKGDEDNLTFDSKLTAENVGGTAMYKDGLYWSSSPTDKYMDAMSVFIFKGSSWSTGYFDSGRRQGDYYNYKVRPVIVF